MNDFDVEVYNGDIGIIKLIVGKDKYVVNGDWFVKKEKVYLKVMVDFVGYLVKYDDFIVLVNLELVYVMMIYKV